MFVTKAAAGKLLSETVVMRGKVECLFWILPCVCSTANWKKCSDLAKRVLMVNGRCSYRGEKLYRRHCSICFPLAEGRSVCWRLWLNKSEFHIGAQIFVLFGFLFHPLGQLGDFAPICIKIGGWFCVTTFDVLSTFYSVFVYISYIFKMPVIHWLHSEAGSSPVFTLSKWRDIL